MYFYIRREKRAMSVGRDTGERSGIGDGDREWRWETGWALKPH